MTGAETGFYDAAGPSEAALPVTEPGGSWFMVIAATYAEGEAASNVAAVDAAAR